MSSKKQRIKKDEIEQAHCVWGLICSLSSSDQERNNISLFNIIEEIQVQKSKLQPKGELKDILIPIPHEIVILFRRLLRSDLSNEDLFFDCKVKLVDPQGGILQEIVTPIKIKKELRRLRFRANINHMKITEEGDYVYRVEVKYPEKDKFKTVFEIPFEVRFT